MESLMDKGKPFVLKFNQDWIRENDILQDPIRKCVIRNIRTFFNWLGFYVSHDIKILSEPVKDAEGFRYEARFINSKYHIFYIKIWTKKWKTKIEALG